MLSPLPADARAAAEERLARADEAIETAVLSAMSAWLDACRVLIIAEAADQLGLIAAGFDQANSAVDAAVGAWNDWRRGVDNEVLPAVAIAFGEAFQAERLADRSQGSFTPQMEYMETVRDRLKIWPDGAFEELRPELVEALAGAETIEQITDRVGMVLGIDKDQRAIKAAINDIEKALDDPQGYGLDSDEIKALRADRRALWEQHDAEETKWRWLARRIARTEAHGAVNYGQLAAARQNEADTGDPYWKRWLATEDTRTRASHRVADGQSVRLAEKFRVGTALLDFPGDPSMDAPHETINCRCSMMFYVGDAMTEALDGQPEVRQGTDEPETIAQILENLAPDEDTTDAETEVAEPTADELIEDDDVDDVPAPPAEDLSAVDIDQLLALMLERIRADDGSYEAVRDEYERREHRPVDLTSVPDDGVLELAKKERDAEDPALFYTALDELDGRPVFETVTPALDLPDKPGGSPRPPHRTAADYYREGKVAPVDDPDMHFEHAHEKATAARLREMGLEVLSVYDQGPDPDADALINLRASEIKLAVGTPNSIHKQGQRAAKKGQNTVVVFDAVDAGSKASPDNLLAGVRNVIRSFGAVVQELLVISVGRPIRWRRDEQHE
ncbi:hypothetical protein JVX90_00255 [Gordonia sp. PDNC005]|uniref:phage minor head protein n=1 Tax=Gordonia sp. PDNC005 TaxID=2811424 RepID=UPI0019666F9E|nr:phage minor head protein [Gordonia sp. PDNC005]QRY62744.1 hypothetical protein JVX90_00255 [Gordonia sp. PDNC005]